MNTVNNSNQIQNIYPVNSPSQSVCIPPSRESDSIDCVCSLLSTISQIFNWILSFFCKSEDTAPIPTTSLHEFIPELENHCLQHYLNHENISSHPLYKVHGRLHACRATLFTEILLNFYLSKNVQIDKQAGLIATSYHDSGRLHWGLDENGRDPYEPQSAEIVRNRLLQKGYQEEEASHISNAILSNTEPSIFKTIVQSSDCIDIMRNRTGRGGRAGFNFRLLTFLNTPEDPLANMNVEEKNLVRRKIVDQAWEFIQFTDARENEFHSHPNDGYFTKLLSLFHQNKEKWPYLHELFMSNTP